ncbi:MAG: hypothetical protein HW384_1287 [Dehalococcoidia bacterium]|nr:hypothetical protein [Dehalococcoidia bacterium]
MTIETKLGVVGGGVTVGGVGAAGTGAGATGTGAGAGGVGAGTGVVGAGLAQAPRITSNPISGIATILVIRIWFIPPLQANWSILPSPSNHNFALYSFIGRVVYDYCRA